MLEIEAADHLTTDRQYAFEMCLLPFTINIGDIALMIDNCPNIQKLKLNFELMRPFKINWFGETDYTGRWSLMIMNKTRDRKIGSKVR